MGSFEFELDPSFRFELETPTLRVPRRSARPSLGVPRLRIDPEIHAMLALRRSGALTHVWLLPDSVTSLDSLVQQRLQALGVADIADVGASDPDPTGTRIRGGAEAEPETRAGKPKDLFNAIWALPAVANARDRVVDEMTSQLRRGWREASTGERVLLVSHTALIGGTAMIAILANDPSRTAFLRLLSNVDIPVPMVDGMSFRVNPQGASFTVPLGLAGLAGSGSFSVDGSWEGRVMFDVMRFLSSRRR